MQWTNLQALTVNPADFSSLLCTDFCTNNVITGESVLWMFWTGFCAVLKVVILRCTPSFHADKSSRPVFFLWNCCVVVLLLHVTINNVCGGTDLALVQEFLFCQGVFFFMELLLLHLFIDLFFGFFHGHPNYQVWFSFCTYANSNISLPSDTCENHRHPN